MSGSEKSIRPIRQLSLQPPAPRRQQVRRQRSAEDEKSLQICASPFARGKRGTCKGSERPKVRVAWRETRQKNEEELGQVEVVARQIPGRSKSTSGRSRGIEKSILYSRLELAERLRLAWQNREKNKANINIFLARETLDERCDSEISNGTAPSSPVRINDESKIETPLDNNYKTIRDEDREKEDEKVVRKLGNNDATTSGRIDDKLHVNFLPLEKNKVSVQAKSKEREKVDTEKERVNEQISRNSSVDEYVSIKKKQASDCSNHRVTSTSLPSIKIENSTLAIAKTSREDFSSAKQKRASFHSGTNRAFLDPIRSEIKWSSEKNSFQKSSIDNRVTIVEKNFSKQTIGNKENDTADEKNTPRENNSPYDSITNEKDGMEKIAVVDKSNCVDNKNAQIKTVIENRDNLQDDKTITPREMDRSDSTCRKISSTNDVQVSSRSIIENKDDSTIDKSSSSRNFNSMNDRNPPIKKTVENQKIEQKSRRTNSAPPQRRFESISPNNNRVHVNIGIDSMRKNRNQKDQDVDCKYNTMEKTDTAVTKISSSRGVRSAPLKRRSRSAKRRFCGGGTSKNEEDGKSRNRSGTRAGKNSIDSRTMDIVTMVSLVSSADSDSDIENSFRDDKLIDELRSKLPTTSIIKTSINSALSSARRPIKSAALN